ncbi:hypothetical protein KJ903_03155 [Patescibacteria group bacterium]|nr:hypothetical protein [Patescibacteria group bacterium]
MKLTKQKIYIAVVVIVVALIAITAFLAVPLVQDIYSLTADLQQNRNELAAAEAKGKNLKQIKDNQQVTETNSKKLDQTLISRDNTLDLILPIEKIASKNNVEQKIDIVNVDPDEGKKSNSQKEEETNYALKDIPYLSINISLKGEFKNIASYILDLESIGVYTDITNITISAPKATSSTSNKPTAEDGNATDGRLNVGLQLRAFTSE